MRKLLQRIQAALTAAAYAEEGEVEMARQVVAEAERGDAGATPGRKPARPAPRLALPPEKIARLP